MNRFRRDLPLILSMAGMVALCAILAAIWTTKTGVESDRLRNVSAVREQHALMLQYLKAICLRTAARCP